jgi:sigma-B regulation protein RsbU (phosphoserine phosphatase)
VGDVAGHGIPSALVAASAKVELAMNTEMELDPAKILMAMNAGLMKQAGRKRPMSFWMAIFDPVSRILQYSNAGQNFPVALITGEEPKMVEGKGYPLGARQKTGYTTGTVDFSKGGRLFAYSDGIVEAHTAAGDPYDYSRFVELTQKHRFTPINDAIKDVFEQVRSWSNRDVPEDDQTLVILDIGGKP